MQGRVAVLPPIGLRDCKGPQGEPRALAFLQAHACLVAGTSTVHGSRERKAISNGT